MTRLLSKNIWYGIYLAIATMILLEIVLRIYNPFHFRIKGDQIRGPDSAGAEKLGNLVYSELKDYLASKYPDHLRNEPFEKA